MSDNLSISISAPIRDGKGIIELYKPSSHFHVVLKNNLDKEVNFWKEETSWGYYNLSFQVTVPNSETIIVNKKQRDWDKNFPDYFAVEPKGYYVINVDFKDDDWEPLSNTLKKTGEVVSLLAIFNVPKSVEAEQLNIWVGRVTSKKKEFVIWS